MGYDQWLEQPFQDDAEANDIYEKWIEDNEAALKVEWLQAIDPWEFAEFQKFVQDRYYKESDDGPEDFTGN